jgi:hypothetical protein
VQKVTKEVRRPFGIYQMEHLSDKLLIDAYYKAIELNLADDFISIIKEEIYRRTRTVALFP